MARYTDTISHSEAHFSAFLQLLSQILWSVIGQDDITYISNTRRYPSANLSDQSAVEINVMGSEMVQNVRKGLNNAAHHGFPQFGWS